jgi:hypothetical protein
MPVVLGTFQDKNNTLKSVSIGRDSTFSLWRGEGEKEEGWFKGSCSVSATACGGSGSIPSPCEVCCRRNGIGTGFSPSTSVLRCKYHSTGAPHSSIYTLLLPVGQTGESWELSNKQFSFGKWRAFDKKKTLFTFPSSLQGQKQWDVVCTLHTHMYL